MFNNPLRIVSPGREKEAGREATKDRIEGWFARKRDTLEYFFNGEPRKKDLQPREERDSLERSGTGSGGTWQKPNPDRKSHRNNVNESSSYADSSSLCLSLSHAYVPIVCTVSKKKKRKRGREQANRGMFFLTTDGERGREKERERERILSRYAAFGVLKTPIEIVSFFASSTRDISPNARTNSFASQRNAFQTE